MSDSIKLTIEGNEIEIPTLRGVHGELGLDIAALRKLTKAVTLDPGYVNTASCKSAITFLDGEQGLLEYRGYKVEDLAQHSNFLEVSYLLLNNKLPASSVLEDFKNSVAAQGELSNEVLSFIKSTSPDGHPMGSLSAVFSALTGFYPNFASEDLSEEELKQAYVFSLGQMKSALAAIYRHSIGKDFIESNNSYRYCKDFLSMMFPEKAGSWSDKIFEAMDVLLLLHADHEQNCSATTVRTICSANANLFASLSGGMGALWGSSHGGANQAVVEMLEKIYRDGNDINKYINKAKDKSDPFRIMGFGHRVYKNFDPRARIIKKYCDLVLDELKVDDPLLDVARSLEEAALSDEYFVQRKLYPNVDFYSGIIYRALGIPTKLFTPLFALGRLPGWLSQWHEQRMDKPMKITRPRQIYVGEKNLEFIPIDKRS